ncbi:carboxylating nicotinate-nucleotide diphosphorylase [bacterium]|nr:MAG: carboxylating nicotinate-nucleotide diphosphorylase [bacterium]
MGFPFQEADRVIRAALTEDIGPGDVTTLSTVPEKTRATAFLVAKEDLRLAGLRGFTRVFELLDPCGVTFTLHKKDGDEVLSGETILEAEGPARILLTGERVALNLLQRLCGIATMTSKWVKELEGTGAKLADTRKTTPGFRALEKYAVRVGGGVNHRFGLFDGVLIKENHIRASGSITNAVKSARQSAHHLLKIEVEVTNLDELREALFAGADAVLLDNMDLPTMAEAVAIAKGKALVEASGGMSLPRLREVAETGVDIISAGALTHSAPASDLSLLFKTGN